MKKLFKTLLLWRLWYIRFDNWQKVEGAFLRFADDSPYINPGFRVRIVVKEGFAETMNGDHCVIRLNLDTLCAAITIRMKGIESTSFLMYDEHKRVFRQITQETF